MKKGLPAFEKLSLKIHKPNRNPHSARPPSPGFVQHWLHCPSYGRNEALVIMVRASNGYTWAVIINKRSFNNSFWGDFDALPWNCISGVSNLPTHDLLATPRAASSGVMVNKVNGNIKLDWTNGDGDKRLVTLSTDSASNAFPLDGRDYTADPNFGSGDDLGNSTYAVYNGNQNSVIISGLDFSKTYYARIFEYNKNSTTGQHALYTLCNRGEAVVNGNVSLAEQQLKAYLSPNPVVDQLNIQLKESLSGQLEVINSAGQVVYHQDFQETTQLHPNLSNLPQGFYLCPLSSGSLSSTYKFLKQ